MDRCILKEEEEGSPVSDSPSSVPARGKRGQNCSPEATDTVLTSCTVKKKRGSGCLRRILRLMEGWRLVCDCVLYHVPLKHNMGSKFRVSGGIHSVLVYTGSCGNT